MNRVVGLAVLVVVLCLPAFASDLGQPQDCADWTFLAPGYSCQDWQPYPCTGAFCTWGGVDTEYDNEGRVLYLEWEVIPNLACLFDSYRRIKLMYDDGVSTEVIGYIDEQCNSSTQDLINNPDRDIWSALNFDDKNGVLLVRLLLWGRQRAGLPDPLYSERFAVFAIDGFATTFDVMQTYSPGTEFAFRVPYMPEGFQYADYFDTYWGDLATVGTWSQAQPLQCGYPATAPNVGDYLTIEETLPSPAPGRGYYFVTAVNYQGQRRYGRQSNGGVLSGRNPAVLPACE